MKASLNPAQPVIRLTLILLFITASACSRSSVEVQRDRLDEMWCSLFSFNEQTHLIPRSGNHNVASILIEGKYSGAIDLLPSEVSRDHKLLDYWGNPYVFSRPEWATHLQHCRFYSTGPNGIDEEGQGDDVTSPPKQ